MAYDTSIITSFISKSVSTKTKIRKCDMANIFNKFLCDTIEN